MCIHLGQQTTVTNVWNLTTQCELSTTVIYCQSEISKSKESEHLSQFTVQSDRCCEDYDKLFKYSL